MLIAIVVMFNILNLIMKIVSNYPIDSSKIPLKHPSSQRGLVPAWLDPPCVPPRVILSVGK
jgi:hypothetical protein